jgi:hypothetical protein
MKINIIKSIIVSFVFLIVVSSAVDNLSAQTQISFWDAKQVYLNGDQVKWKGNVWQAKWWTRGNEPGTQGEWGVWNQIDATLSFEVTRANWNTEVVNGVGVVELSILGRVEGVETVTVETYGDGVVSEQRLEIDQHGIYRGEVQIQFTHAPTREAFIASTVVRAKQGNRIASEKVTSSILRYPIGNMAFLTIETKEPPAQSYPITGVLIDDVLYDFPCNVELPKGMHKIEVVDNGWKGWWWSDIHTMVAGDPLNPRYIDLARDKHIYIYP